MTATAPPADTGPTAGAQTAQESGPAWPIWALVLAATGVALALRAPFVDSQGIGYEELFTASVAGHASIAGVWNAIGATESTPPLYYVLTWLSLKAGGSQSLTALRLVSLLAGAGLVPVAFLAARRFVGDRLALVVAWLCAINPWLVVFSTYARSYALFALVATLSIWALGAVIERPSRKRWALWAAAAIACLWTHYFALFLVLGEVAVLALVLPRNRAALAASIAAVAAGFAPLLSLFTVQSSASDRTAYIGAQPLASRLEGAVRQFAMGTNVPNKWLEGAGILVLAGGLLFGLWAARGQRNLLVLVAVALIAAGLPTLTAITGISDELQPRNVLGAWICVAILAAIGLARARAVPLALYTAICLVTVVIVQTNWRYEPADWRGAAEHLLSAAHGQPVAVMPGLYSGVAGLYMQRPALAGPTTATSLWVMVSPERGPHERALTPLTTPPLGALFGAQFRAVGEIDYHGFRMIHLRAQAPLTVTPTPASNGPADDPDALLLAP